MTNPNANTPTSLHSSTEYEPLDGSKSVYTLSAMCSLQKSCPAVANVRQFKYSHFTLKLSPFDSTGYFIQLVT